MKRSEAIRLRGVVEQAAQSLDDKTASTATQLFGVMKHDGSLIKAGARINWHGTLKQAAVDLWDTETNTPDAAPTLWEDIAYREGIRIIPDVITAGTAFSLDEPGWWNGHVYRSMIAANVYTPDQYAAGWEQLT